jgi:D-sedoheptulose 7-phosphate isomerase
VTPLASDALAARIDELLARRAQAAEALFGAEAERIARLCHGMAERFAAGGRLVAMGLSAQARSDVRHVTVEFVHPVIVGKRALPALGLSREGGSLGAQVELAVEPGDIAIAFGQEPEVGEALAGAGRRGALTIGFGVAAEWEFALPSDDPAVAQEEVETLYHVLWELVHVFFEHPGLLEGREARRAHDSGASSFLYPFLAESETELEPVLEDVRGSVLLKSAEAEALREQTLREGAEPLAGAAAALRECFARGGKLLALGNGGSATDAMDVVADLREPPGGGTGRRALDLTEDPAVITAIANDIGPDAIFQRQVIAHGRANDVLLALSTSGNSRNVIEALAEGRRRGLVTVAMVGYDGGRVADEGLADHVVVTRSEHIPRIQEAQASAYHALVELL